MRDSEARRGPPGSTVWSVGMETSQPSVQHPMAKPRESHRCVAVGKPSECRGSRNDYALFLTLGFLRQEAFTFQNMAQPSSLGRARVLCGSGFGI